jgi:hypothetical protein
LNDAPVQNLIVPTLSYPKFRLKNRRKPEKDAAIYANKNSRDIMVNGGTMSSIAGDDFDAYTFSAITLGIGSGAFFRDSVEIKLMRPYETNRVPDSMH